MPIAQAGHIAAVVLAAGASSRMGRHKLLLPLGGQPLVAHVVAAACASSAATVLVVTGRDREAVAEALAAYPCALLQNDDYMQGLATSLHLAISYLDQHASRLLLGALFLLGDQPLLTATHLDALLAAAWRSPGAPVAATYGGKRGNPVYFPRALFPELAAVQGDEGGRSVLARHRDTLVLVELGAPELALDVDAPADYERIVAAWRATHPGEP